MQNSLFFHPVVIDINKPYLFKQPFTEVNITVDDQTNYNIVQFSVPDSIQKGVVLYFHGNRENINHYAQFAVNFTRNQYAVWMPDYPGFGKSTGKLSEQLLYDEALQAYKLARTRYPPEKIIIYGKSIGTGIAAQLASVRDCKSLILETPYFSFSSLLRNVAWMYPVSQLSKYHFPTNEYLLKVTAPITIFHGTHDGVIPYRNANKLRAVLKPVDSFVTIEGGSHNDLNSFSKMQKKLDSLLHD